MPQHGILAEESCSTRSRTRPREKSGLQSEVGDLKNILTSDIKSLEFTQLVFGVISSSISSLCSLPYVLEGNAYPVSSYVRGM